MAAVDRYVKIGVTGQYTGNEDHPRRSLQHTIGSAKTSDLDRNERYGVLQENSKPKKVDQKSFGKRTY